MKKISVLLFVLLVGCAPALDAVQQQVKKNVDSRLGSSETVRPSMDEAKLASWLNEKVSHPLGVSEVSDLVLVNNPSLLALYDQLAIDRAQLIQASTPDNPFFLVERRFRGSALEVDIGQNILSLLLLPSNRRLAEGQFEIDKLHIAEQITAKVFEARTALIQYQGARAALDFAQKRVKSAGAAVITAEELRSSGNLSQGELLKTRMKELRARLDLAQAELNDNEARTQLGVLIGLPSKRFAWRVSEEFPSIVVSKADREGMQKCALSNRLDLEAKKKEFENLARSKGVKNIRSLLPELTLTGHYEHEPMHGFSVGPSIELPIPFFDFGGAQRERARAEIEKARHDLIALAQTIDAEVSEQMAEFELRERAVADIETTLLPAAKESFNQAQRLYNGMLLGVLPLIEAREIELDAEAEHTRAVVAYWESFFSLERAAGGISCARDVEIAEREK